MSDVRRSNDWCIGLAAWIIQDGDYPDLHRGQTAEFSGR